VSKLLVLGAIGLAAVAIIVVGGLLLVGANYL
jgi:hypothetical protein